MIRVVCYDVKCDRRRNRLFKLLKDYGSWTQFSVFEVECSEKDWIWIEHRLEQILAEDDSLCVYTMCGSCSKKSHYSKQLSAKREQEKSNIL